MQDDDTIAEARRVNNPKGAGRFPDADFPYTGTDRFERLPICGIEALLDFSQLVASQRTSLVRKVLEAREAVAKENNWLHRA